MPDEKDPVGPDARSDESSAPATPAATAATSEDAAAASKDTDTASDDAAAKTAKTSTVGAAASSAKDADETEKQDGGGRGGKRLNAKKQSTAAGPPPIVLSVSGIPMVQSVDSAGGGAGGWTLLPPPRDAASGPWVRDTPTLTDRDQSDSSSGSSAVDDTDGLDGDVADLDGADLDDAELSDAGPDDAGLDEDGADGTRRRGGKAAGVKVTGRTSDAERGDGGLAASDGDDRDSPERGSSGSDRSDLDETDFDEPDFDDEDDDDEDDEDENEDDAPRWQKNISGARPRRRELSPEVKVAVFGILAALLLTVGAIALSKTLSDDSSSDDSSTVAQATESAKPLATTKVGDCVYTEDGQTPARDGLKLPPAGPSVNTNPAKMVITTNLGTMTATLDAAKAPCTVHALQYLADQKYFDGSTCHRETSGPDAGIYVLQCGDPTGTGGGTPGFQYKNENTEGVDYNRGVLAMANAGADTNGSQFFINYADPTEEGAQALAGGYTVFGQITEGLDVLDKITGPGAEGETGDGAPVTKPEILSVTITQ